MRTKVIETWNQATVKRLNSYDFKGNLLSAETQHAANYSSGTIYWTKFEPNSLDPEVYHVTTIYDALNHPVMMTQPDGSVTKATYNIRNQIQRIDVQMEGNNEWKAVLLDEQFNARNQRILSVSWQRCPHQVLL
jgi:YD repeat-containing protein